jgi:tetratricopeptide (TPR) repeat protein
MSKNKPTKLQKKSSKRVTKKKKKAEFIKEPLSVKTKLLVGALFAILAMGLYAPSYNYDFVYDDDAVIQDNRFVHKGMNGLKDIWSTSYFRGYNENMNVNAFRPVPLTTFAIEYQFAGLNASSYHITNIILYGLTGFFLFYFLSTLLYKFHPILPIAAVLFFIVHPLHVEVVANIKSRDELLAFLNFSISAWLLLKYVDTHKIWAMVLSLLFYSIALFSKESTITTLAIIPAILYFFRQIKWSRIGKLTLPFLGLALFFLIYRYDVIGSDYIQTKYFDNSLLAADSIGERIASNINVLGFYLYKTIIPHPLISDYSYNTLPNVGFDNYKVYLTILAYGGLIWLFLKGLSVKRVTSFAIIYFFITVSIFSNVFFPGFAVYNDRFLYHPVLGISILLSWVIYQFANTEENNKQIKEWIPFIKNNPIPLLIILILSGLAIFKLESRLPDWENRYVLFEKDSKTAPNNARMRKNYGGSLARQALASQKTDPKASTIYANQAIKELEGALSIYERQSTGHIHLGNMYTLLRKYDKAEKAFSDALKFDSKSHHAQVNLANIYYRQGRYGDSVNLLEGMSKTHFTNNDYNLLSLAWSRYGNEEKAAFYRKKSGR